MQVELIGCTSAGKSTLKSSFMALCAERQLVVWGDKEYVLKQLGLNWIQNELLRTLLVDLAALIACLLTFGRNRTFYQFTLGTLRQLSLPPLDKFYILRNVLRKLGKYEIITRRDREPQIILVDEGVWQVAHNLFVHASGVASARVEDGAVATFAQLAPQPDAIIYLRQPATLLVERIVQRGHKRIVESSQQNVVRFVTQAIATFDELSQNPAIQKKLLRVENGQCVIAPVCEADNVQLHLVAQILRESIGKSQRAAAVETAGGHRFAESTQAVPVTQSGAG